MPTKLPSITPTPATSCCAHIAHVDRDRTGQHRTHDTVTCDVPKHAALLQHQTERQRKRNAERYRRQDERAGRVGRDSNSPLSSKDSRHMSNKPRKKHVGFHFVFGSDRQGNCLHDGDSKSPHENITLTYEIGFLESEGFKLSVFRDHVTATHLRNLRSSERMTNSTKAEALRLVSTMSSALVQNWIDQADESAVSDSVMFALSTHGVSIMDVHDAEDEGSKLRGYVRIAPNTMRLAKL